MSKSQSDEEVIAVILLAWEEAFERGQDISAVSLCGGRSDLVTEVRKRIELLRSVGWLNVTNATTTNVLPKRPILPVKRPNRLAGRYELKEHLGSGGFGEVWRAYDNHLGRPVAVKMPHKGRYPNDTEARNRFLAEAQRVAKLSHPGIVPVFDVSEDNGTVFIISELIDGEDLGSRMKRIGQLPIREAVRIVIEAANNLHYAHQHNFIHRDVKPSNLLIRYDGKVFITDFGIAISTDEPNTVVKNYGTLPYMAPERRLHNVQQNDVRSDVYSLGIVLFELLTVSLPMDYKATFIMAQGNVRELVLPKLINCKIPSEVERIVLKCLASDPIDRYQSTTEIADDLTKWRIRDENGSFINDFKMTWKLMSNSVIDEETHAKIKADLEDRTKAWIARPEARLYPSLLQTYYMFWLTNHHERSPQQHKMLSFAGRYYAWRVLLCVFLLLTMVPLGFIGRDCYYNIRASILADRILESSTYKVPDILKDAKSYHSWVDPKLRDVFEQTDNPRKKLNASIGLMATNHSHPDHLFESILRDYLFERLLSASPDEIAPICNALLPVKRDFILLRNELNKAYNDKMNITSPSEHIAQRLWKISLDSNASDSERLRAACALINYDSKTTHTDVIWPTIGNWVHKEKRAEWQEWVALLDGVGGRQLLDTLTNFKESDLKEK